MHGSYDIPVKPGFNPSRVTPEQVNRDIAVAGGTPTWYATEGAKIASGGRWRAAFGPPTNQAIWVVRRIVAQCDDPNPAEAYMYICPPVAAGQAILPQYMVSNTRYGNLNENEAVVPYIVPQNMALYIVWNTTAGTYAHMNVEYVST